MTPPVQFRPHAFSKRLIANVLFLSTLCAISLIISTIKIRLRKYNESMNTPASSITLSTLQSIPGQSIQKHFGIVSGNTIRAKHIGRDMMAGLKNIFGGELKGYTELLNESREEATNRMIECAQQLGANAIVNVRYATSSIAAGAAEIYVYGTAVSI